MIYGVRKVQLDINGEVVYEDKKTLTFLDDEQHEVGDIVHRRGKHYRVEAIWKGRVK